MAIQIRAEPFGYTKNDEAVLRYTMTNSAGMEVKILSYGCTVQCILVPDASGRKIDVADGGRSVSVTPSAPDVSDSIRVLGAANIADAIRAFAS